MIPLLNRLAGAVARLTGRLWRVLRPRRSIWPTREGWWALGAAVGLGFAAVNTGNNLLHLLTSFLLGLIVVSGILSERTIRGLRVSLSVPDELFAGQPAIFMATVQNRKRWSASYSVRVEVLRQPGDRVALYLPRLAAGDSHAVTWEDTMPRRGRHRLRGLRLTTRFPFGLFLKATDILHDSAVLVFPAVREHRFPGGRQPGATGVVIRRRGRGTDLHSLREYQPGDDPRLIHWPSTARAGSLVVRQLSAETTEATRVRLVPSGDPSRLEAGLSEAASRARHLIRDRGRVELVGPGVDIPLGTGRAHERAILVALAVYDANAPEGGIGDHRPLAGDRREVCIPI